jgi:hypothetical protein
MKKIFLIAIAITFNAAVFSQSTQDWVKTFGGNGIDLCYSVSLTSDNNYVSVGRIYSEEFNRYNYMILKFDSNGKELWRKISNSSVSDEGRTVVVNSAGELVIAGNRGGYPLILKTNSSGDTIWTRQINDNPAIMGQIVAMRQMNDSSYVLAGVNGDMVNLSENKIWVIKINNNGYTQWSKIYSKGFASSLTITKQNDIIIIGGDQLIKLNSKGDVLWNNKISGNYSYEMYSVKETADNGFILVGSSSSNYNNLCLIKTDSVGNKIWEKMYGGDFEEVGKDVIPLKDGGYFVLGYAPYDNTGGAYKVWLMKTDATGDTLWTKKYSVSDDIFSYAYPESFIITSDNKIFVVGYNTTTSGNYSWFISKYSLLTSDIYEYPGIIPNYFTLYQNFPNPFNPTTRIKFNIPYGTEVRLFIYDINGKLVSKLLNKYLVQGLHEIEFNCSDLSSGIYFYQLQTWKYSQSRKMLLIK